MSNLCVIRTHRNKKFATINLTANEDKKLSWKAKGIHTYLISRPEDWEVYLVELEKRSTDGRDGLRTGLIELHKTGYLDWNQENVNGKFLKTHYDVYEVPNAAVIKKAAGKTNKSKKSTPHTEKPEAVPCTGLPDAEKPEAVKHDKKENPIFSKEKTSIEPHTEKPESGKSAPTIYHIKNKTNNDDYNNAPQSGDIGLPEPLLENSAEQNRELNRELTNWQSIVKTTADVCGLDVKIKSHVGMIVNHISKIKEATIPPTPEILKKHYGYQNGSLPEGEWNWFKHDWRGIKGSRPKPAQIVETWGNWEVINTGEQQNGKTQPSRFSKPSSGRVFAASHPDEYRDGVVTFRQEDFSSR
jgi:hypothetical protein